jgi:phage terminase small subunit
MNRKLYAMLKAKQEAFAEAYAENPNGAEAARTAGYAEASAKQEAVRQLANPEVVERIQQLRLEEAEARANSRQNLTILLDALLNKDIDHGDSDDIRKTIRLMAQVNGVIGR